jgi:hypothetical protein
MIAPTPMNILTLMWLPLPLVLIQGQTIIVVFSWPKISQRTLLLPLLEHTLQPTLICQHENPNPPLILWKPTTTPMSAIVADDNLKYKSEDAAENETAMILADVASWVNYHEDIGPTGIELTVRANAMQDRSRDVGLPLFDVDSRMMRATMKSLPST